MQDEDSGPLALLDNVDGAAVGLYLRMTQGVIDDCGWMAGADESVMVSFILDMGMAIALKRRQGPGRGPAPPP